MTKDPFDMTELFSDSPELMAAYKKTITPPSFTPPPAPKPSFAPRTFTPPTFAPPPAMPEPSQDFSAPAFKPAPSLPSIEDLMAGFDTGDPSEDISSQSMTAESSAETDAAAVGAGEETAEEEVPKKQTKLRKFLRAIFDLLFFFLIIAIIGGSAMFALSDDPEKSYFGYRLYEVKTPSMKPAADGSSPPGGFNAGDIIIVKQCPPEEIKVNDIVTYIPGKEPDVYLTHRVVEVMDHLNDDEGLFFLTKGDANADADPPIMGSAVVGKKVFSIPAVGFIIKFIRGNLWLCLIIVFSAFGSIILLRMYFSSPEKEAEKAALKEQAEKEAREKKDKKKQKRVDAKA